MTLPRTARLLVAAALACAALVAVSLPWTLLPVIDGAELLDANVAQRVRAALEQRIALAVALLSAGGVVALARCELSTLAQAPACVATTLAAFCWAWLVPRVHAIWLHVDRVALRPVDRAAQAQSMETLWLAMGGVQALCWLAVIVVIGRAVTMNAPAARALASVSWTSLPIAARSTTSPSTAHASTAAHPRSDAMPAATAPVRAPVPG